MRTYATILCLLLTVPGHAVDTLQVAPQPEPYSEAWRWSEFSLPGAVRDIFEDRDGNVWFATDRGAVRYDGTHYRTFTSEEGLGADRIRTITQTPDGALWFGTWGGGITRMLADSVRTYTVNDGLADNFLWHRSLKPSGERGLWAGFTTYGGSPGGLSRFDGRKWSVVETPADSLWVMSLTEVADGSLWVASFGQGLLRYRGGEWTVFGPEQGLPGLNYAELIQTSDGSIWATSWDETAIARYKDDRWIVYRSADGLASASHAAIWETPDRRLWSASSNGDIVTFTGEGWRDVGSTLTRTSPAGVYASVSQSGSVWLFPFQRPLAYRIWAGEHFQTRFDVGRALKGGHRTPDGSTWFVTEDGPVRYDGQNWVLYGPTEGLLDPPYVTMTATEEGSVWFLADQSRGWCRYVAGRWETHRASNIGLDRLSPGPWELIYHRPDDSFWVTGSLAGKPAASRYNGQSWQVLSPGVDAERLSGPFVSADGDVWFSTNNWRLPGTLLGEGAMRFDPSAGAGQIAWTHYTTDDGLLHNRIYGFGQSPDGTIWAGTLNGISWFTGTAWSGFEDGFPGNKAGGFQVSGSDLWCVYAGGGGLGVSRYSPEVGQGRAAWRTYRSDDGLAGDSARKVLPDPDGTIWVATEGGISHFDPRTELWASYTEEDGIWPGVVQHLWFGQDGRLNYTTQAGLTGSLMPDQDAPETVFRVAPTEVTCPHQCVHIQS